MLGACKMDRTCYFWLELSCFMLVLQKEARRESSMCDPFCENPAFLARALLTLEVREVRRGDESNWTWPKLGMEILLPSFRPMLLPHCHPSHFDAKSSWARGSESLGVKLKHLDKNVLSTLFFLVHITYHMIVLRNLEHYHDFSGSYAKSLSLQMGRG